ncbi:MAG: hypothetical protein GEU97_19500 [Actinophytocola sp.]|nr:hypothetical protein [Actinophytocola sp.]
MGGIPDICMDIGRVAFEADGTHFVVDVWAQDGAATGAYRFEVIATTPDEVRDIALGDRITGSIDKPGAKDVYRLTGRCGQAFDVDRHGHRATTVEQKVGSALFAEVGATVPGAGPLVPRRLSGLGDHDVDSGPAGRAAPTEQVRRAPIPDGRAFPVL